MTKRVRYGLPGLVVALVLVSGVMCFWFRDAGTDAPLIFLLTIVAGGTTAIIVLGD